MSENLLYKTLSQKFPFITILTYGSNEDEYVGVVQNSDNTVTTLYDFGALTDEEEKKVFLTLGEKWYYESNRLLPINIYLKEEWKPFEKIFKTFITKEVTVIHGNVISLNNLGNKKKRRSILVVKKMP